MPMNIILVDDHKMFRDGVRTMLAQQVDAQVVGEASDGSEAIALVRKLRPCVVIMDLTLPRLNGIDATYRIRECDPAVKLIALSMHTERHLVREMLQAGVSGYVLKECAFEELAQALYAVCTCNQMYLSPAVTGTVVDECLHLREEAERPGFSLLTSKEREILQLVAEGKTSQQIAQDLHASSRTVEKHRYRLMEKLDIHHLAGLVRFAIREGITRL